MKKKQPDRICNEKFCKRKARKGRTICTTCDKKKWRQKHPMKAAFQTLRQNSRRRGKEFTLTFQEFEKFCYETKYMAGKGRSKESYTIDRHDDTKGYTIDNIRVLTKSNNSIKRKMLVYDWETKSATVTTPPPKQQ